MKARYLVPAALALSLLTACASDPYYSQNSVRYEQNRYARNVCQQCGVVQAVDQINYRERGIGLGAVIGAVAGAALGNTVGDGDGRRAATVAGAIAGGAVGHNVERRNRRNDYAFRYEIRMDDGRYATVTQRENAGLRRGDRVRISGNSVYPL